MIGNCKPVSDASPTFFCRIPNRDSATFEQVGPTATNASVDAMRRTTEMPSSALQRSSRNSMVSLALAPSPSVTPPALLISSAAAFNAASLFTPNTRTTPDLAPKPVILTVRSCADAGVPMADAAITASDAATAANILSMAFLPLLVCVSCGSGPYRLVSPSSQPTMFRLPSYTEPLSNSLVLLC